MNQQFEKRFVVDSTLGRLGKWLRLMGYDTVLDSRPPDPHRLTKLRLPENRLVLTRSRNVFRRLAPQHVCFISYNDPTLQIIQLIRDLRLRREDLNPFSRCGICNQLLHAVSKKDVRGRVPDYVFEHQDSFLNCPACGRFYWDGSHQQRWAEMLGRWFEAGDP